MTLKTKDSLHDDDGDGEQQRPPRLRQRVPLPHNSLLVMGLQTNARWMRGMHTDKRPDGTKDTAEHGARISLTFRRIGTFPTPVLTPEHPQHIYGQGATTAPRERRARTRRPSCSAERLLAAFGAENHQSEFDWDEAYGEGFAVLHFAAAAAPGKIADGGSKVVAAHT